MGGGGTLKTQVSAEFVFKMLVRIVTKCAKIYKNISQCLLSNQLHPSIINNVKSYPSESRRKLAQVVA